MTDLEATASVILVASGWIKLLLIDMILISTCMPCVCSKITDTTSAGLLRLRLLPPKAYPEFTVERGYGKAFAFPQTIWLVV